MRSRSVGVLLLWLAWLSGCVSRWDLRGAGPLGLFRKTLTVHGAQVGGSLPLAGFPVLVSIAADPDLRSRAHGGSVAFSDGRDLTFEQGAVLPYEIEAYDSTAGTLVGWVRLPSLTPGVDASFDLLYGSTAGGPSLANPPAVWAGYRGVWHLNQDPSGPAPQESDSTAPPHPGTTQGAMTSAALVPGRFGSALAFDGTDDTITLAAGAPASLSFDASSSFSYSVWVNASTIGTYDTPWYAGAASPSEPGFDLELGTHAWDAHVADGTTADWYAAHFNAQSDLTWHHLAAVLDRGTGVFRAYYDGAPAEITPLTSLGAISTTSSPCISRPAGGQWFRGDLQEVRVAAFALSSGWVATEFANQSSPSSFYSVGPQH